MGVFVGDGVKREGRRNSYQDGLLYEGMAELYLRAKGFRIIARRYKTPHGEIDLITMDNDVLVFVEVKGRLDLDGALYAVTPRTRRRIEAAAGQFLSEHTQIAANGGMRFDVIAISLPFSIRHIDNAWLAGA